MAKLKRYRPNRRGIRGVGRSRGVIADLTARAGSVAGVAQSAYDAAPPHTGTVIVDVLPVDLDSFARARVAVLARHPAALRIEADRRPLGGALDAARR